MSCSKTIRHTVRRVDVIDQAKKIERMTGKRVQVKFVSFEENAPLFLPAQQDCQYPDLIYDTACSKLVDIKHTDNNIIKFTSVFIIQKTKIYEDSENAAKY